MATSTLEAPTPVTTRRRRSAGIDPNAHSKRVERAFRLWAAALDALEAAATACEDLSEAMGDLLLNESDPIHGDNVREDSWHAAYFIRTQLSLIESDAPHEVTVLARRAS
jgi:hypothetical protein